MTSERIKEIQEKTAYPESVSVQQALLQVWNECEQEKHSSRLTDEQIDAMFPHEEYGMNIEEFERQAARQVRDLLQGKGGATFNVPSDVMDLLNTIAGSDERIYRERAKSLLKKYENPLRDRP